MGNKPKGMFITDFDGTLLKSDKTLCPFDIEKILELKNSGIVTAVATGRSVYSFETEMERLGIEPYFLDYLIFSTGAGILSLPGKKLLKSSSLESDDVKKIHEILNLGEVDHMIHKPIPDTKIFGYSLFNNKNKDFHSRLKIYENLCFELENEKSFGNATLIIAIIPQNMISSQTEFIFNNLREYNLIRTTSPLDNKSLWIEIFPKDVSKSSAASWLADTLEINKKNILAIGNDYNDEDLLLWADNSYITANAPEDLKDKFLKAPSNDSGAVKTIIEQWKLSF